MNDLPELDGTSRRGLHTALLAINRFYAAFNGRDLVAMGKVWAEDGVLYNALGGVAHGWQEMAAIYRRIFAGAVTVQVAFFDYTFGEAGDVAWAVGRERGTACHGADAIDLDIRTSRVFRRIGGRWRQAHHHGSIDDPKRLAAYQRLVRG
jgi:ketosteroid isomerase-like protein